MQLREHIKTFRQPQIDRAGRLNADLLLAQIQACCPMGGEQRRQLAATMNKLSMSARATYRVIKMARTIADYEGSDEIRDQDLMEAISYRRCQFSKLRAR